MRALERARRPSSTRCARWPPAAAPCAHAQQPAPRMAPALTTSIRSSASPGLQPVLDREQLVQRSAERAVEQVREAAGRERARSSEIGSPSARRTRTISSTSSSPPRRERGRHLGVGPDHRGRDHARVGLEALAAQVGGQAGQAGQIALDLALGDEDAAGASADAPDGSAPGELGEGRADASSATRRGARRSRARRRAAVPGPARPAEISSSRRSRTAAAAGPSGGRELRASVARGHPLLLRPPAPPATRAGSGRRRPRSSGR